MVHDNEQVDETENPDFIETIKRKVVKDIINSEDFLSTYRDWCKEMHATYHSSEKYTSLRKKNKMAVTWIQEDIDQFRAEATDKLWYNSRPCRIIGREDADKADAEAKQLFMDYQDVEDKMFTKFGIWLRDAALYKCCVAQVFYEERTKREWVIKDIPMPSLDENGNPILDEEGNMVPAIQDGQIIPSGEKEWVLEDVVVYRGATTRRIDPSNLLFTVDKVENFDKWPVMVRSFQNREFFDSEPYFFNKDILDNSEGQPHSQDIVAEKKGLTRSGTDRTQKPFEYIEWQAEVDKRALYEYKYPDDERKMATVRPGDKVLVVVGIVDQETIVRLDEDPLKWGRPNIVIGYIDPEEDSPHGRAISQMIESYQKAAEDLNGMQLENFKQSVNAMWVINKAALVDKKPIVNKAGTVLLTNDDPSRVVKRIEQARVAPDIYLLLEQYRQAAQNADGMQDILKGRGERGVETLGEATQVLSQAGLRLRSYIKHFEESFVVPLYTLRNHINASFIDQDYAFRVVGEKAQAWRSISPEEMRTPVDFICESSTRETQRAVIVQQMLQFAQIAPLAAQLGQPVRLDKMLAELGENGFGWSQEKIEEYFPLIRMERQQQGGQEAVDQLLIQGAMTQMQMPQFEAAALQGGNNPKPKSESEAIQSANARNQPNIRSI